MWESIVLAGIIPLLLIVLLLVLLAKQFGGTITTHVRDTHFDYSHLENGQLVPADPDSATRLIVTLFVQAHNSSATTKAVHNRHIAVKDKTGAVVRIELLEQKNVVQDGEKQIVKETVGIINMPPGHLQEWRLEGVILANQPNLTTPLTAFTDAESFAFSYDVQKKKAGQTKKATKVLQHQS